MIYMFLHRPKELHISLRFETLTKAEKKRRAHADDVDPSRSSNDILRRVSVGLFELLSERVPAFALGQEDGGRVDFGEGGPDRDRVGVGRHRVPVDCCRLMTVSMG